MKNFNTKQLLNRVEKEIEKEDTILTQTRYRKDNGYLAYYGYGWYKMGMTNNPERRERELNIYHFGDVKILTSVKVAGKGVIKAEKKLIQAFKSSGARTKGEFVFIPSEDPEVVAKKYKELMGATVKKLSKNTQKDTRKTNNILKKNGYEPIETDVSLIISK
jgi:hypothetical protein